MADSFLKRQEKWDQFERWKSRRKGHANRQKSLRLIGQWVDFFLSRHFKKRSPHPDVQGIVKMHRCLSRLS